jgi:hypothetical protein
MSEGTSLKIYREATLTTGSISGAGSLILYRGTLLAASSGSNISVATSISGDNKIDLTNGNVTISGQLSGAGRLSVSGQHTLFLSNPDNKFSDGVYVSGGIYVNDGATLSAGGIGTGTLHLSGGTLKTSSASSWQSAINFAGNTSSTIDTTSYAMTITGNVSGSGSLIKQGKNELVLNSNTTIGGLQVETGKVRIGATSSIDRVQLGSTTTLYIGEKGQLVTNTVSGDGELVLQNGTLKAAKGGSSISSATTYTDAKIDLSQGSLSLQGELSGSGTLQVSGQNTLTLGKTDYSTAVLDLSGSTLAVNDGTSLGTLTLKDGASVTIDV